MKWQYIVVLCLLCLIAGCLTGVNYLCPKCDETVTVRVDTVFVTRTGAFTATNPAAVKTVAARKGGKKKEAQGVPDTVYYESGSHWPNFVLDSVPCDSVRTYVNHFADSNIVIKSISQVQGVLLQEDLSYSYISPVSVTSIVKRPVKRFFVIPQVGVEYNSSLTPVAGVGVIVRKWYFGYHYGMNQSQRGVVGWAF